MHKKYTFNSNWIQWGLNENHFLRELLPAMAYLNFSSVIHGRTKVLVKNTQEKSSLNKKLGRTSFLLKNSFHVTPTAMFIKCVFFVHCPVTLYNDNLTT